MFYNASTYTGSTIKELYLPKTITKMPKLTLNLKLEILSMPGVSRVYQNEGGYTNWALSCNSLKTLIVSEGFASDGQVFFTNNGGNHDMTVYTMSTTKVSMPGVTNVTSSEKEFTRDCGNLRTVIVGDTFTCILQGVV